MSSAYSDNYVTESGVEVEEEDWMDLYEQYQELHQLLFEAGTPHDSIFHGLVHGKCTFPDREDVACLLDLSQGDVESAREKMPTSHISYHYILEMACLEGKLDMVNAVLEATSDPLVIPHHLELAVRGGHTAVVQRLLETGELDDFDVASVAENAQTVMQTMLMLHLKRGSWCSVM